MRGEDGVWGHCPACHISYRDHHNWPAALNPDLSYDLPVSPRKQGQFPIWHGTVGNMITRKWHICMHTGVRRPGRALRHCWVPFPICLSSMKARGLLSHLWLNWQTLQPGDYSVNMCGKNKYANFLPSKPRHSGTMYFSRKFPFRKTCFYPSSS